MGSSEVVVMWMSSVLLVYVDHQLQPLLIYSLSTSEWQEFLEKLAENQDILAFWQDLIGLFEDGVQENAYF